jgi:hypothetical protein
MPEIVTEVIAAVTLRNVRNDGGRSTPHLTPEAVVS